MINWSLLEQGERFDSQGNLATEHRLDDPGVCIRKTSTSGFGKVAKKKNHMKTLMKYQRKQQLLLLFSSADLQLVCIIYTRQPVHLLFNVNI